MSDTPDNRDSGPTGGATPRAPLEAGVTLLELRVANLDCEGDAAKIERGLTNTPGLLGVTVYPKAAKVALRLETGGDAAERVRVTLR